MSLYVPGSFLVPGTPNEVLVMELDGCLPASHAEGSERALPSIATQAEPDFSGPPGGAEPL